MGEREGPGPDGEERDGADPAGGAPPGTDAAIVLPAPVELDAGPRTLVQYRFSRVFLRDSVEYNRIVNLTDAVVAIALTLLVLQLAVPALANDAVATNGLVIDLLRDLYAPALAFTLSFVIIAFSWFGHHRFVDRLNGFDNAMILWNFCYLFTLVLVPFASDVVGNYGDTDAALIVYAIVMALLFGIDFPGRIVANRHGLLADHYTRKQWWAHGMLSLSASFVFLVSIPVFLVTEGAVTAAFWVLIWPLSAVVGRWVVRVDAEAVAHHAAHAAPPA
jgi:uncharacterized membrane protein